MKRTITSNIVDLPDGRAGISAETAQRQKALPFPVNVLVICSELEIQLALSDNLLQINSLHTEFSKNIPEHINQFDLVILAMANNREDCRENIEKLANESVTTILLGDDIDSELIRTAMHFHVQDVISFKGIERELFSSLTLCANEVVSKRKVAPVISIINGKSGSGASFITSCLGEMTADLCSDEIVLIDADLHYGSLADALNLEVSYFLSDALDEVNQLDNLAIKSMMTRRNNLSLLASKAYAQLDTEQNKNFAHLEPLLWKIKLNHDLVLIDLSRGLDTLTLPLLSLSNNILIVVQQNIVSLRETKALVQQLTGKMGIDIEIINVIVNRHSAKVSNITLDDIKKVLGINTVFCVSNNYQLASSCTDLGSPLTNLSENKIIVKEIRRIIEQIFPVEIAPQKTSLFSRIFRR